MKRKTKISLSKPAWRRSSLSLIAAATFGAGLPAIAQAVELDWRLKASLAGVADSGRDLDLNDADDTQEGYIDVTPWLHAQFSEDWAAFLRVRAFAPTGSLLTPGNDSNNAEPSDNSFVALREAWIEYGGITSYPGEVLRLGRQRIRNEDAQFFDQDIDALRWIVDTTLLDAELGAAHQFDSYRSDGADITRQQKDRSYVFGHLAYDWAERQRVGLRAIYAIDDKDLPAAGETQDLTRRETQGKQAWIGVYADNHPYDWRPIEPQGSAVSYWASATLLTGDRDRVLAVDGSLMPDAGPTPPPGMVTGTQSEKPKAWAAEAGVRAQVAGPLQLGAAYSYSSGGSATDADRQYEQTGVQSNYSRFTGTRAQIYRYNEAFRPELGNLQVLSGFASVGNAGYDASLVYNHFRRPEKSGPVVSDGLTVSPLQDSRDLGQGLDLVASKYFSLAHLVSESSASATAYTPSDDADSSLRLRASWFKPGDAYGPGAEDEYRAMLELTLWY